MHRDIKPENILIDDKDHVKLIDFGTSSVYQPGTKLKKTFGTPYYIAPEVLSGSYNHLCDMWSAGIIMYTMLIGRPPFDGITDDDVLREVVETKLNCCNPRL